MSNPIEILKENNVDLWNVAEYLLLGEESAAGKQDENWEKRWKNLRNKGTWFVNVIYKNKIESKLNTEMLFKYLEDETK